MIWHPLQIQEYLLLPQRACFSIGAKVKAVFIWRNASSAARFQDNFRSLPQESCDGTKSSDKLQNPGSAESLLQFRVCTITAITLAGSMVMSYTKVIQRLGNLLEHDATQHKYFTMCVFSKSLNTKAVRLSPNVKLSL